MKLLIPFSWAVMAAGDTITATPSITSISQLGALGVLSWTVWHLLTRTIPNQQKASSEQWKELVASQSGNMDRMEQLEQARGKAIQTAVTHMQQQVAMCAEHHAKMEAQMRAGE